MKYRSLFALALTGWIAGSLFFGWAAAPSTDTFAQENTPAPTPATNTTIHVVQRGETLFSIAQQYGTSVEAVATANGITDTRFLSIGQRLLIPNVQLEAPGVETKHLVLAGETAYTLTQRYSSSLDQLMRENNITHPERFFVGQLITIRQGATGNAILENAGLYTAVPGDSVWRIAVRFGVAVDVLQQANGWATPFIPVWDGQRIIIPNRPEAGDFVKLPAALLDFNLAPFPAIQGQSLSLGFTTRTPMQVSGLFMGRAVQFAALDATTYATMLGIHAFAEPGVYGLELRLTDDTGIVTTYEVRLVVEEGGYGSEEINIPAERAALLDSTTVQPELEQVARIMSGFTSTRYFDGLMGLPAPGGVTSQFGTRRSYNGSPYNTFHGGADFGGAIGTPITAPADGVVVLAEPLQVRGNTVIIDHGWGVYTGYWHQSQIFVQVGQVVKKGDTIGALGGTGLVTGPHLHWEMWVSGVQVDPLQWVQTAFP